MVKVNRTDSSTEGKILQAARKIFIKKGLDGARMQEIADEAGINKALLHYYFRSKQKLFDAIFMEAINEAIPKIGSSILMVSSLVEKIEIFIDHYIEVLIKNPFLPAFILKELNRDPDALVQFAQKKGLRPHLILGFLREEMKKAEITHIKAEHFLVNIISMCVFPFAARPIIQPLVFQANEKEYLAFLEERKAVVKSVIINSIQTK